MKKNCLIIVFALISLTLNAGSLVKIDSHDLSSVKKHMTDPSLRIHYTCDDFLIATASGNITGNFKLLKTNAWVNGENYFILWTDAETKPDYLEKIGPIIEILDQEEEYIIANVSNEHVADLFPSVHGGVVRIFNTAIRPAPKPLFSRAPGEIDPFVQDLLNQVDVNNIQATVQHLQDYGTRNCLSAQGVQAQNWIQSQFESYGLPVTLQNFTVNGQNSSDNVIATLTGTKYPDQYIILGGHYDSYSYSGSAPGADDNATGTACVMEIARIFSQYTFDRTIIFIAFSGEEYGLDGSEAYATMAENQGMNILGYFNTDMCGYLYPGYQIHTDMIAPTSAQPLVDFYTDVVGLYLPDFPVEDGQLSGGDSDHTSFNNHGFMGIFPFEDSQHYSPYIHTSNDLIGPSVNSFPMALTFAKATVASVATMANMLAAPQHLIGIPGDNLVTLSWDTLAGMNYFRIYKNAGLTPFDSTTGFTYSDTQVTNGTLYSYYVSGIDSATGRETPKSNTVTLRPMVPMALPFTDNFETGALYWQFEDTWGLSTIASHSPTHSISESPGGNYGDDKDISAVLGPFSLAGASDASISFWTRYDMETNYDYMYFLISTDGQNWTQLAQFNGTQSTWLQKNYSLVPYLGNPHVWLRFRFTSDGNTVRQGMYIDDFAVSATISAYTLSGTINYPNTAQTPLQGISIQLKNTNGTVISTTTTNASGQYSFSSIPNGNYTMVATTAKPWGGSTAADVLLYKKHIADIEPLSGIFLASGDVNASGEVTALDVLLIRKRIANLIYSFPAGDWLFNNTPVIINGGNIIQDFYGLTYGDANGSYIPAGSK